jgi:hypothetical protein
VLFEFRSTLMEKSRPLRDCELYPSPGGSSIGSVSSATERREALKRVYLDEAKDCRRCPLHQTRTKVVFGAGDADADLMFVGEAPGRTEDETGLPFVGQAGKLLDKLLGEIGLTGSLSRMCSSA